LTSNTFHVGFNWTYACVRSDRSTHVRLLKADLVCHELALLVTTSFNFNNQSSQNVCDRIFFAGTEEAPLGFNAGVVSNKNLIVRTGAVTNSENVRIAADNHASKLHLRATRN